MSELVRFLSGDNDVAQKTQMDPQNPTAKFVPLEPGQVLFGLEVVEDGSLLGTIYYDYKDKNGIITRVSMGNGGAGGSGGGVIRTLATTDGKHESDEVTATANTIIPLPQKIFANLLSAKTQFNFPKVHDPSNTAYVNEDAAPGQSYLYGNGLHMVNPFNTLQDSWIRTIGKSGSAEATLELAMRDNASNEYIYDQIVARHYKADGTIVTDTDGHKREVVILGKEGESQFPGPVTSQRGFVGDVDGNAKSATKAKQDWYDQVIDSTYLSKIVKTTHNGSKFEITSYDGRYTPVGSADAKKDVITIPGATTTLAGLVTTGDQTITGNKTIDSSGTLTIAKQGGFIYSGIQEDKATDKNLPLWFSTSTANGTPNYSTELTYNPSTGTVTAKKFAGPATSATYDAEGGAIHDKYLKRAGGTMTGALKFADNIYNAFGDDVEIGSQNAAGKLNIRGKNGATGIVFVPYSGSTSQTISIDGAGVMTITGTVKTTLDGNASTATTLKTARNFNITDSSAAYSGPNVSFNGSADVTLHMPDTFAGTLKGNADTATKLATARTLWGQSFNGTANISGNMTGVGNVTSTTSNTYTLGTSSNAWKAVYATTFYGALSGNADTATKLQTARSFHITDSSATYNGVSATFDGSAAITLHMPDTFVGTLKGHADSSTRVTISDGSSDVERKILVSSDSTSGQNVFTVPGITANYAKQTLTAAGGFIGNASSASKLQTAKKFTITDSSAAYTGTSASFDGTSDVTLHMPSIFAGTLIGDADRATLVKYSSTLASNDAINNFLEANILKVAIWKDTSFPGVSNGIILSGGWTSTNYGFQLAIDDDPTWYIALRQKGTNGWGAWKRIPMGDGTGASGTWGVSITGNAATASAATKLATARTFHITDSSATYNGANVSFDGTGDVTLHMPSTFAGTLKGNADSATKATKLSMARAQITTATDLDAFLEAGVVKYTTVSSNIGVHSDGMVLSLGWGNGNWGHQIFADDSAMVMQHRHRLQQTNSDGTKTMVWSSWSTLLDSANYTSYTVKKDGTGATGTWGINITGNAATATQAQSALKDGDLNEITTTYLKRAGGTMTGDISFATIATWPTASGETYPIKSKGLSWNGSSDWAKIFFRVDASDQGHLIINLGDSTNEKVIFAANTTDYVNFEVGGRLFYPTANNTGSIGTSSYKWANIYATTFNGALSGNAATASKWQTARNFQVDLALDNPSTVKVDGSTDVILPVIGILGTVHGGTGNSSHTANRLVWTETATKMTGSYHYADTSHIGVNYTGTTAPSTNFYANGTSYLNGNTTINGQLYMALSNAAITWNQGSYWQRMITEDDSTAGTHIFKFQVSSNSGTNWTDILRLANNGQVRVQNNVGGIYKLQTTASTVAAVQVISDNQDSSIFKVCSGTAFTDSWSCGFDLKYIGTGAGVNNLLTLYAGDYHNTGTQVIGWSVNQAGQIGIKTTPSSSYSLNINGNTYSNGKFYINNTTDASLSADGVVTIGPTTGENLTFDSNEIMARNNKAASTLYLNNEGGLVQIGSGGLLVNGQMKTTGPLLIGSDVNGRTKNYIAFYGTTSDGPDLFTHAFIGENIYGGTECSELLIFKGNDPGSAPEDMRYANGSGPDRIRHIAAGHLFQIYRTALSGTFATVAQSTVPISIFEVNQQGVVVYNEGTDANNYPAKITFRVKDTINGTTSTATIAAYSDHGTASYGSNLVISSGGNTLIQAGDGTYGSYANLIGTGVNQGENLYLTADGNIQLCATADTSNRKLVWDGTTFYPSISNTFHLGSKSYRWASAHVYRDFNIYGTESTGDESHVRFNASDNSQRAIIAFNGNTTNTLDATTHLKIATNYGDIRLDAASNYINVKGHILPRADFTATNYNIGSTTRRWGNVYANALRLQGPASDPSEAQGARIEFAYDNGTNRSQPVYISYTPNDGYRVPYGLKIFGTEAANYGAWLEVQGAIGTSNTNASSGIGISLYGGPVNGKPTYGMFFGGTSTFGKLYNTTSSTYGVSSDWATYFTMSDTTNRGWLFMRGAANVAGITGNGTFLSTVTTGTHLAGNQGKVIIDGTATAGYNMLFRQKSTNGVFTGGAYSTEWNLYYTSDSTISASTNGTTYGIRLINEAGNTRVNRLGINGEDVNYRLYVNGTSHLTSTVRLESHNQVGFIFRQGTGYATTLSYLTSGNEAMVFATKNAVTSFIFVNGEDSAANMASDRWTKITPALQIKNNSVYIGKLIENGTSPSYKFYVNGTSYFASNLRLDGSIYQNGGYNCSGNGSYSYYKICTINIASAYINRPVVFEISGRGRHFSTLEIIFQNINSTDPALSSFTTDWDNCYYIIKTTTSTWEVYGAYSESWGNAVVHRVTGAGSNIGVTMNMTNVSALPSGYTQASYGYNSQSANYVRDKGNGTATYMYYSSAGMSSASWYAAWDGYTLRSISPANLATHLATSTLDARYVNVTGDTMSSGSAQIQRAGSSTSWYLGRNNAFIRINSYSGYNAVYSMKTTNGDWACGVYSSDILYWSYTADTNFNAGTNSVTQMYLTSAGYLYAPRVYNAVWNDYAEFRCAEITDPGRVVIEDTFGNMKMSTERLQPGGSIISDTYGHAMGETKMCKTPIAVAGRVLAYPYEDISQYQAGDAVCTGPNGTVSKMTREEIREYPDRIIGIVSEIPTYEAWGQENIKVNGRIWIKVR